MKLSLLMPYSLAGPDRERTYAWVMRRWHLAFPDSERIVRAPDVLGDPARFCRALAINRAAAAATGDVFVIADADTAFDPHAVQKAVWSAAKGGRYVLPERYVRLDEATSDAWLRRLSSTPAPAGWEEGIAEEWPANVSGVVVVPRGAFEAAGGFDERFRGWGWEDGSFHCAVETLWGPAERTGGVAWHLWHPRPPEDSIWGPYAVEQRELGDRYLAANGDAGAMRALIAERP